MSVKDQAVMYAFFAISCLIGLLLGFVGFGVGLILLEPWQASGVFILSTGLGSLFATFLGAKYLARQIIKGVEEAMANDQEPKQ